jgi:NHL repeat-containing protein
MYSVARHETSRRSWEALAIGGVCALLLGIAGCNRIPDGGAIDADLVFGDVGLSNGQFSYPRAIDAGVGSVVVVDKSARVQRFDADTGDFLGGFRMPEWKLGKPTGVTLGPSIDDPLRTVIYVADTHYHRVAVYPLPDDPDVDARTISEPELSFGEYGVEDGQFVYLTDVALLLDQAGAVERIYVSEYGGNDRISVFTVDRSGEDGAAVRFLFSFGTFGDGPGVVGTREAEFERPQALAIDHERRELFMLDNNNHRIGTFTLEGELIGWIGVEPGQAEFLNPQGFVLLEGRRALVTEFLGNRVQVVDLETGASLGSYGHAGRLDGELASPWGVAMVGRDAFVLDSGNNRVQRFRGPGRVLGSPWLQKERVMTQAGGSP